MKKVNYILAYIFCLVIGWLSLSMTWGEARNMFEMAKPVTGYDVGGTLMLYPIAVIVVVSLIGFIKLKALNIIADIICLITSLGTSAFMMFYISDSSSSELGALLMLLVCISLVIISILTLKESISGNKSKKIVRICTNCGAKPNKGEKFCIRCGTRLEETNYSKEHNVSGNGISFNKFTKGHLKAILALVIGVVVVLSGSIISKEFIGNKVSKKQIKSDLIGSTIRVGNMEVKATQENIKSLTLGDADTTKELGIEFYDNNGTIVIESDMYKMELPFKASYMKYSGSKEWLLVSSDIKTTKEESIIEIKSDITEDQIKALFKDQEIRGVTITDSFVKDMTIESMEKDDYGVIIDVEAIPAMADKLETSLTNISGTVYFDGEKWDIKNTSGTIDRNINKNVATSNSNKNNSNSNSSNNNSNNNSNSSFGSTSEKLKNDFVMPNSSTVKLNFAELNEYTVEELFIARNELLARNGYSFNDKPNLKRYFQNKSWYKENPSFNGELTNEVEKWNLSYIESVEFIKVAYEKYGDITADYVLPGSSSTIQSVSDIKRLSDWELIIARNEIYGRYGLNFSVVELKRHFLSKQWFKVNNDIDNNLVLSEVETKNVSLILEEERRRLEATLYRDL